jgi:glc operon protein GlcG
VEKKWVLTNEDVQKIVAASKAEAAKHNLEATIAVVDAGGHLLHLERPYTHRPNSVEMSTGKARTGALRGRPSSALESRAKERPGFLMTPNCLPIRGGVPIFYNDEIVGGVGVSGIDVHDEPVAQAGADAIKD